MKDLSFWKFWIFWNFQNWSSFNELKWTLSIDGHSRQIQVRIRNLKKILKLSKILTTQSKLENFSSSKFWESQIWNLFSTKNYAVWRISGLNSHFCYKNGIFRRKLGCFGQNLDYFRSNFGYFRRILGFLRKKLTCFFLKIGVFGKNGPSD